MKLIDIMWLIIGVSFAIIALGLVGPLILYRDEDTTPELVTDIATGMFLIGGGGVGLSLVAILVLS